MKARVSDTSTKAPPRLESRAEIRPGLWPAPWMVFAGWAALLGAIKVVQKLHLGFPLCALRVITGIPCPTCGGTRALLAWTNLDLVAAFRFNPLVSLACLGVCAGFGLWLFDRWLDRGYWNLAWGRINGWPWLQILLVATIANWVYLLVFLPR